MTKRKTTQLLAVLLLAAAPLPLFAQEDPRAAEIHAAAAEYLDALRRGDAAAIADSWTDDGVYIDANGHSASARSLTPGEKPVAEAIPPRDDAALASIDSAIHFVAPTVALEHGRADAPTGAGAGAEATPMCFVAAWVKDDGRWRLSLLREFASAPPSAAESATTPNPLADLDWMVGRWTAPNGAATIELTAEWTPGKSFLIQRFVAKRPDGAERSGEQRIAWDAVAKRIRSWTFNADGSFSEAHWRQEGDVWVADATGALADGRPTKSVHFWMPEGDGACWFKSLNGEVDGKPADDLVLKFTRTADAAP